MLPMGIQLPCETITNEPIELTVINSFHPLEESNFRHFDSKLNTLTTRPWIHCMVRWPLLQHQKINIILNADFLETRFQASLSCFLL